MEPSRWRPSPHQPCGPCSCPVPWAGCPPPTAHSGGRSVGKEREGKRDKCLHIFLLSSRFRYNWERHIPSTQFGVRFYIEGSSVSTSLSYRPVSVCVLWNLSSSSRTQVRLRARELQYKESQRGVVHRQGEGSLVVKSVGRVIKMFESLSRLRTKSDDVPLNKAFNPNCSCKLLCIRASAKLLKCNVREQ
jgi:hypothetical protein